MSIEKTVNVFNSEDWYKKFDRFGTSDAPSAIDPNVQVKLTSGGASSTGTLITTFPLSTPTLTSFDFSMEVFWEAPTSYSPGDSYSVIVGDSNSIEIKFVFWSGYTNNGFSGTGIYWLVDNVAVGKSTVSPFGAGSGTWYPVRVAYKNSVVNTWTVYINSALALVYSDANNTEWKQISTNDAFIVSAYSGGGLRLNSWVRKLNLNYNANFPIQTSNTSAMPQKFYPSADDSTFSSARAAYTRVFYPRITLTAGAANEITKRKLVYENHDASSRMERLKLQAIGQSSMRLKETETLRFKAPNVNDARDALRRSRSRGYALPPKVVNR